MMSQSLLIYTEMQFVALVCKVQTAVIISNNIIVAYFHVFTKLIPTCNLQCITFMMSQLSSIIYTEMQFVDHVYDVQTPVIMLVYLVVFSDYIIRSSFSWFMTLTHSSLEISSTIVV